METQSPPATPALRFPIPLELPCQTCNPWGHPRDAPPDARGGAHPGRWPAVPVGQVDSPEWAQFYAAHQVAPPAGHPLRQQPHLATCPTCGPGRGFILTPYGLDLLNFLGFYLGMTGEQPQ